MTSIRTGSGRSTISPTRSHFVSHLQLYIAIKSLSFFVRGIGAESQVWMRYAWPSACELPPVVRGAPAVIGRPRYNLCECRVLHETRRAGCCPAVRVPERCGWPYVAPL